RQDSSPWAARFKKASISGPGAGGLTPLVETGLDMTISIGLLISAFSATGPDACGIRPPPTRRRPQPGHDRTNRRWPVPPYRIPPALPVVSPARPLSPIDR